VTIPPAAARLRLDVALAGLVSELSRARIQQLIENGNIRLNGEQVKSKHPVKAGDQVSIELPPVKPLLLEPEKIDLQILFEDEALLVVNKPAGLVVHPGSGTSSGTLVHALLHHSRSLSGIGGPLRPGVVHRLDKETSGCLVVAKNDSTHLKLIRQFAGRQVEKLYLALCSGRFRKRAGEIEAPIGRHPVHRQKMAIVERGRPAKTRYLVLQETADWSLVVCRIYTGRTHQIRVHLKHLGHPILGDAVYGRRASGFHRQMLHAWRLGFSHPTDGRALHFEAPLPEDFKATGVPVDIRFEHGMLG
jgi:23S rRNA pseudouridine1911/1915/1917 synthase